MSSDEVVAEAAGDSGPGDLDDPGVRSGEYRVEVLSTLAGLTVRTIREYQAGGLLPGPRKVGRHAYYNEDHLLRLQLIERLQQRGYANAGIRDLLGAWSSGRNPNSGIPTFRFS